MLLLNPSYGKITDEKTDKHSRNSTLQTSSILTIFFIFPGLFIPKKPSNNFANYFSNNEKKIHSHPSQTKHWYLCIM